MKLKWRNISGRVVPKRMKCWKDIENYVRDKEKENNKMKEDIDLLEATMSVAKDEIENYENALLEINELYQNTLLDKESLIKENKCLIEMLNNLEIKNDVLNEKEFESISIEFDK